MSRAVRELCQVLSAGKVGAYRSLTLIAPGIAASARPGQFVEILTARERSFLLRRPFSVHQVARSARGLATVEVIFDVVGPGTAALAEVSNHDVVDAVGPLGRPFRLPREPVPCLLVGGGYGSAPLFFLAERLRVRGCRIDVLAGAATADRLFKTMDAKRVASSLTVTTVDGSIGTTGIVTDVMPALIDRAGTQVVYACGPMPMLAAVARLAARRGLACQVAVEEQMACGTGICFSCVLPVRDPGVAPRPEGPDGRPPTRMARTCVEGPVFDARAIDWTEAGFGEAVLEPVGAEAELTP